MYKLLVMIGETDKPRTSIKSKIIYVLMFFALLFFIQYAIEDEKKGNSGKQCNCEATDQYGRIETFQAFDYRDCVSGFHGNWIGHRPCPASTIRIDDKY
jgi:hypothetical protein